MMISPLDLMVYSLIESIVRQAKRIANKSFIYFLRSKRACK